MVTGRNGSSRSLREIIESNYKERNPDATEDEVNAYLDRFFEGGGTVFKDLSTHEMKVFYMERGAGASNLYMRFNLTSVKPGEVTLTKKVTGSDDVDYDLMEFPYRILYHTREDIGHPEYSTWKVLTQDADNPTVTYQGGKRPVKYAESFTSVGETVPYDNVFFLKPGETASINMPDDAVEYKIVECGVNMNIFKSVSANGDVLSSEEDTGRRDYEIGTAQIEERPKVDFENEVDPESLRTLTVSKVLWDENGFRVKGEEEEKVGTRLYGYDDDSTVFGFRVFMSAQDSGTLVPARNKEYFVKDPSGDYCKWDIQLQQFVSLGTDEYQALLEILSHATDEERAGIVFETSINGSVSKIPAGFSFEFRGLPVGSSFMVIEREDDIPEGYELVEYERDKGSYISHEGQPNEGTIRANEDPHVLVHNKRGWGLTVNKAWSDADYIQSHDDIYFAVYVNGDMLPGSVRKLSAPDTSLYYYFDNIQEGASFDDYQTYEVRLTNPGTDADGAVTYDSIEKIDEGGTLTVGGLNYEVAYERGEATGGHADHRNVREDTVYNTRRGIRLVKQDWDGNPLSGAVFTLKDSNGNPVGTGTYTSGMNGEITIAYIDPGEYILEETVHPGGFQKSNPWHIIKGTDGKVSVIGDEDSYEVTQETADQMAFVVFKNKGFSLKAVKIEKAAGSDDSTAGGNNGDGGTNAGTGSSGAEGIESEKTLGGAVFALYRQLETVSGLVKDPNPLHGYEELTTGTNGVIPKITSALPADTYYLSEVTPPSGYKELGGDLVFTISPEGVVEIPSHVESADTDLVILNNSSLYDTDDWLSRRETDGHVSYTIQIPNELAGVPVRIVKTNQTGQLLENAFFTLSGEMLPDTVECKSVKVTVTFDEKTVEEALLYENSAMPAGTYELTETAAPAGYNTLDGKVEIVIKKVETGLIVTATVNGEESSFAHAERIDVNHPEYGWRVTVINSAGYELPSTGGEGTRHFTILGFILIAGAGLLLLRRRSVI